MNNRIQRSLRHILRQQVEQTVLGNKFLSVIDECQTGIQVRVVAQQLLDIIIAEMIVLKEPLAVIGHKLDDGASFLCPLIIQRTGVANEFTLRKHCFTSLAFAE